MEVPLFVVIALLSFFLYQSHQRAKQFRANWMFCRRMYDLQKELLTKRQEEIFSEKMSNDLVLDIIPALESNDNWALSQLEKKGVRIDSQIEDKEVRDEYLKAMTEYRKIKSDSEPSQSQFSL